MAVNLIAHHTPPSLCHLFPVRAIINGHDHGNNHRTSLKLDRRNMLVGLGGLTTTLVINPNLARAAESTKKVVRLTECPTSLEDSVVSFMVPRPRTSRSKKEKEEEEEVLAIEGIEFVADKAVKFDVHVNDDEDDLSRPDCSEFAGSLVFLPRRGKKVRTSLHLGITELLEELGADGDGSIKVTLVPRNVERPITIGGIKIKYLSA